MSQLAGVCSIFLSEKMSAYAFPGKQPAVYGHSFEGLWVAVTSVFVIFKYEPKWPRIKIAQAGSIFSSGALGVKSSDPSRRA